MNKDLEAIYTYRNKGVLIDTNILLLLFVGLHDPKSIPDFKRTSQFTAEDFKLLRRFLPQFKNIVTTPHVLAEVSNMLGQFAKRAAVFQRFADGIRQFQEDFSPSRELTMEPSFLKFGLTDAGIASSAKGKYLVLTDDFRLTGHLQSQGIAAFNFNHLRTTYLIDR